MNREEAHKLIDQLFDLQTPETSEAVERVLPEGKRIVRTKTSGDRVYLIDEVAKNRQWVTSPDILDELGFTLSDVTETTDEELLKYTQLPALYKAP